MPRERVLHFDQNLLSYNSQTGYIEGPVNYRFASNKPTDIKLSSVHINDEAIPDNVVNGYNGKVTIKITRGNPAVVYTYTLYITGNFSDGHQLAKELQQRIRDLLQKDVSQHNLDEVIYDQTSGKLLFRLWVQGTSVGTASSGLQLDFSASDPNAYELFGFNQNQVVQFQDANNAYVDVWSANEIKIERDDVYITCLINQREVGLLTTNNPNVGHCLVSLPFKNYSRLYSPPLSAGRFETDDDASFLKLKIYQGVDDITSGFDLLKGFSIDLIVG